MSGGATLWPEIAAAIEDFDWFVPILSNHSLTSEWFHKEVRKAYQRVPPKTIPVRISEKIDLDEFPKWIAEKHAPLITEPQAILKALDYHTYDNLISRARNHHRKGRHQEAVMSYQEAINEASKEEPNPTRDARLYVALSVSQEAAGDIDSAMKSATKAIDLDASGDSYLRRANCAFKNRDVELSLADFRACLKMEPDNPSALNGLGVALYQHRQAPLVEIADIFRSALASHEDDQTPSVSNSLLFKLNTHLGFVLEKLVLEDPAHREELLLEIVSCFRTASRINPNDGKTRFSLAYSEHQLGNLSSAIEHYKKSITVDFIRPLYCLGYALYEKQQYADAASYFEKGAEGFKKAKELDAQVGCLIGIVRCYLAQDRSTEAIRTAEKAVALKGDDIRALLVMAEARMKNGESREAAMLAQRVADQKCVRASDLLARVCGIESATGRSYAKQAAALRGEKEGWITSWFGIRQTLSGPDSLAFEPADVIHADTAKSICKKRGWACGERCCF
jgi:tetratricopeptide (TPR) repeat protein